MSDIFCVTNRSLCRTDFLTRIEEIANCSPAGIILREKDMSEEKYRILADSVLSICRVHNVPCILHTFVKTASGLGADSIHLPLPILRKLTDCEKSGFSVIGTSCHSYKEAVEAMNLGCSYITVGHIFATDCKKDIPGRGTDFLQHICKSISIPVYAIGGIDSSNIESVRKAGAKGTCIMSGFMRCADVKDYFEGLKAR